MADRRTLEELKALLQGSHAAEQKLVDKKRKQRAGRAGFSPVNPGSIRNRRLGALDRLLGMEPVTIHPLFGDPQEVLRPTARGYRRNPLERSRRKMLADYIRQIREEFPDPKQARAHILDALRADVELGKRTTHGFTRSIKNPLVSLIGSLRDMPSTVYDDFAEEHFESIFEGNQLERMHAAAAGDPAEYFDEELELSSEERRKQTEDRMNKEVAKRRKEDIKEARDNRAFNRRNLRRTPNKELAALMALAIGDLDPVAGLSLTEELNQRAIDEVNRGLSRRKMMTRTAAQVAKPTLPTGPGGGSGGEKVARTFLRLLTRGRTR